MSIFTTAPVAASELIYRPINPGFGGFPANFNNLLTLADIQNTKRDDSAGGGNGGLPTIEFPDIDIDLGGIGGGTTPTAPATPTPPTTFNVSN